MKIGVSIDSPQKKQETWFESDARFNELYPPAIQMLAKRHWTPLSVAGLAAHYLASEEQVKILDIGSGVGKFCLAASNYTHQAYHYGIEQRENLVTVAESARNVLNAKRVTFL